MTTIKVVWGDGNSDPLSGTSTIATHTYGTAGDYNITITATDSNGLTAVKSLAVSVAAPMPGLSLTTILEIVIPIIVVVAIAAFFLLRRRRAAPRPTPLPKKK